MVSGRRVLGRLISRIAQAIFVVWAAATAAFVLLRIAPGDPYATRMEGFPVSESMRATWRAQRGLNEPWPTQYALWLANSARGEFGWSTLYQRPVADVLRETLPRTLTLMSLALFTSVLGGMAIGAWQGTRAGSLGDDALSSATLITYSLPEFWLALLLMQLFAQGLGWLPAGGLEREMADYLPFWDRVSDRIAHLVLPWLTLSLVGVAAFSRFQRSSIRESWQEPFVRTARAKGGTETNARWHAWRASLVPLIMLTGLSFPALLTGAVFVERIYSWPGMGHTTVLAVTARDYEFVTAAVVVAATMTVCGSLLADVVAKLADPRLRE